MRFRASIYIDIYLKEDPEDQKWDLEKYRRRARQIAEEVNGNIDHKKVGYNYIGGVAYNPVGGSLISKEFDRL